MALMPKRVRWRKTQRGRIRGNATRGNKLRVGDWGIQSLEACWLSARQIEAGRIAANHYLRGEGRVIVSVFPNKPITATPAETRMGKGKGEPEYYAAVVRPGTVIYEIKGAQEIIAKTALSRAAHKMPIRCKKSFRTRFLFCSNVASKPMTTRPKTLVRSAKPDAT
ncbi:MAG: 50S ribosomal protein L16 [Planctomycetota bacterium]|jgi:large subunit ribosomal protein L16